MNKCKTCNRCISDSRQSDICRYCLRKSNGFKVSNQYIKARELGKEHIISDETRQKLSDASKGSKNAFYGKTHSKEVIEKIVRANKAYQKSLTDEDRKRISKTLSDTQLEIQKRNPEYYSKIKALGAKSTNSNWKNYRKTSIESKFEEFLNKNNIIYKYSFILNGKYQYDFRIENEKILIEIHGSYWHGNPLVYKKLNNIQELKVFKDAEKKQYAENFGWKVIVFWDYELDTLTFEQYKKVLYEIN